MAVKLQIKKLFPGVDWAPGQMLRAYAMSETGRPNKVLIPAYNTRIVRTGLAVKLPRTHYLTFHTPYHLLTQSIIVTNPPTTAYSDTWGEIGLFVYNGGFQACYIGHGDALADMLTHALVEIEVESGNEDRPA